MNMWSHPVNSAACGSGRTIYDTRDQFRNVSEYVIYPQCDSCLSYPTT